VEETGLDAALIDVECVLVTGLVVAYALALLLRRLGRHRSQLAVGRAFAAGFLLRAAVIAGSAVTGLGRSSNPDELTWLADAHQIAALPLTSGQWLPTAHQSFLHVLVMALQIKLLGSPAGALHLGQVGISLAGVALIVAAVYDLAGPRAAWLAAWLLCLEPAGLLFDGLLLKEPLMELSSGLVVLGATRVWRHLDVRGVAIMGLGCLVALGTRFYIGWFLITCAVLVILHASLRGLGRRQLRALPMIYGVAVVALLGIPLIVQVTSHQSLENNLQPLQSAESTAGVGSVQLSGSHLALAPVNFSTRGAILRNLPVRIADVLLHPYPWQVHDLNQLLGAVGSLVAWAGFFLLARYALLSRGRILRCAGPLLYPLLFLLIPYALATGNAGQGFRYRTHLVTLALAALVVLRADVLKRRASGATGEPVEGGVVKAHAALPRAGWRAGADPSAAA